MNWTTSDDAAIRAWLHDAAPERAPSAVLEATFARTRAMPARSTSSRWRQPRVVLLLAAALALAAIAGGATIVVLSRPPELVPTEALDQPRFLGDFLWNGGYALEVDEPASGAIPAERIVDVAVRPEIASYLGEPDPPIFGRLRCEHPGLCGNPNTWSIPPDAGTVDTWSVWIVEHPHVGAYRVVSAWDGRLLSGWDGDDLHSCTADEVGTEPACTADLLDPPRELPSQLRAAIAYWGQVIPYLEYQVTVTEQDDPVGYWPPGSVDPMTVARRLVDDPRIVDAFQGELGCQRVSCPDGVVKGPGHERIVAIIVVDDGARWVIVDPTTGEVLADDRTPVEP